MNRIDCPAVPIFPAIESTDHRPALFQTIPEGGRRFWEFFTVNVRNSHTRRAYFKAVASFAAWCAERSLDDPARVTPMHVAAYVEQLGRTHSKPTVKQHLAAIRMLFDWLVTGHIMHTNPAHAVRGPKHSVRQGKPLCSRSRRCTTSWPRSTPLPCSDCGTGPSSGSWATPSPASEQPPG